MTMTFRKTADYCLTLGGLIAMIFFMAGCGGAGTETPQPGARTGEDVYSPTFVVGDLVTVEFSGFEGAPPKHDERIKDDGTINLPLIGPVKAAGKTPSELQKEIQEKYKPFYRGLVVTVHDLPRYYTVGGEVNSKGEKEWSVGTDLIKAIQASGGFTEYAKETKIRLIRNGKTQYVNYKKAVGDPEHYTVPIYPKDQIIVNRTPW